MCSGTEFPQCLSTQEVGLAQLVAERVTDASHDTDKAEDGDRGRQREQSCTGASAQRSDTAENGDEAREAQPGSDAGRHQLGRVGHAEDEAADEAEGGADQKRGPEREDVVDDEFVDGEECDCGGSHAADEGVEGFHLLGSLLLKWMLSCANPYCAELRGMVKLMVSPTRTSGSSGIHFAEPRRAIGCLCSSIWISR